MRFLQRVRSSRTRLRDAAALEVAAADMERRRCLDEYHVAASELDDLVAAARQRLQAAQSSSDLFSIEKDMQTLRSAVQHAEKEYLAADRHGDHAALPASEQGHD